MSTHLDVFGDVKEDLSFFPQQIQSIFTYGLGGLSFVVELFLIITIPVVIKRKAYSKLEKWVILCFTFLFIFFAMCILLDPRYKLQL